MTNPTIDRHKIEQTQHVIRPRRWNNLDSEQRRKLIDLITSDMSDWDILRAYRAVVEPSKIALVATVQV